MADQSIGTAKIDLVVSTEQFDAAIRSAKRTVSDMSQAAQQEYTRLSTAQKRATDSAIRQANALGLTREQQVLYNAALRGVPLSVLDELRNKINASGRAASTAGKQLNEYGVSAAQSAAALRGVPAQLTDIIVGLQGGQSPLTVALQQGGQLKDMFGGIVPAAKALGSAVLGLVNPYTLAAGAVAGLATAFSQGGEEQERFSKTLILTGNAAAVTSGQLSDMARSISGSSGFTQGKAAEVLNAVVSSGGIAKDALLSVTAAAIDLEQVAGTKIEETVKVFAKLGEEPTQASAALNEQYHYLTAAVYEQISALEEQGRKDEAAALAQRAYASAVKQRASEVRAEMGTLQRSWDSVANAARAAWDAMLNIGRPTPVSALRQQEAALRKTLDDLQRDQGFETTAGGAAVGGGGARSVAAAKRLAAELAAVQGEIAQREQSDANTRGRALKQIREDEKIAAAGRLADLKEQYADRDTLRRREIEKIRKDAALIGQAEAETSRLIAAVEEKYRDKRQGRSKKAGRGEKAYTDDAATRLLQQYRQAEASLAAQLDSQQKLGSWEQKRVEFDRQMADLKGKAILTADQKSLLANQGALRAQLDRNVALEQENRAKQEGLRLTALEQSLQATLTNDRQRYADQEGAFGLGTKEQQRLRDQTGIYRDYQRQLAQITNNRTTGQISEAEFGRETAALRRSLDERLAAQKDHYDKLDKLQGDWKLGLENASADYLDAAKNYYGQAGEVFKLVTGGMEDAFASFVTTGKLNFKSLADSILADLARIAARQAVVGAIGSIVGSISGGSGASAGVEAAASAAQSSGGDGIGTLLAGIAGSRAGGGPVAPNSLYRVNELGPELFSQGSQTYLMSGAGGGYVTPLKQSAAGGGAAAGTNVNLTVVYQQDGQTRQQGEADEFSRGLMDQIKAYIDQQNAKSWRQGGAAWNAMNGRRAA